MIRGAIHQPPGKLTGRLPLVLLVHGMASSRVEWYDFPELLAERGWSVVTFDFRGHGQSDGPRGVLSIQRALEDVQSVVEHAKAQYGIDAARIGIVAHSLGAALSMHFIDRVQHVKALVALAPPSTLAAEITPFERAGYFVADKVNRAVRLLYRPGLMLPYKVDYERLYASRTSIERARKDSFLQGTIPALNYKSLLKQVDTAKAAAKLRVPTLVAIAELDMVVGPWNSRKVYNAIAANEKQLVLVPRSGHSMQADHNQAMVLDRAHRWLSQHVRGSA